MEIQRRHFASKETNVCMSIFIVNLYGDAWYTSYGVHDGMPGEDREALGREAILVYVSRLRAGDDNEWSVRRQRRDGVRYPVDIVELSVTCYDLHHFLAIKCTK